LPTGVRSWRYRFLVAGKESLHTLGTWDPTPTRGMSLAQARDALAEARKLVKQGINPNHVRKAEKARNETTFKIVATCVCQ
jgi:hypothetical protein